MEIRALGPRGTRLLDALVAGWVVVWVAIGLLSATEIRDLARLSETLEDSGSAITQVGQALQQLDAVPVIGEGPAELGERVAAAGARVQADGRSSRRSILRLSVLLGTTIAVLPLIPVAGLYAPQRLARAREIRAIRRTLAADSGASVEEFLARRATVTLPYDQLRRLSPDPWEDLAGGRYRRLADAELRRLGIRRSGRQRAMAERG